LCVIEARVPVTKIFVLPFLCYKKERKTKKKREKGGGGGGGALCIDDFSQIILSLTTVSILY